MRRIVLTGAPGSGKTVVSAAIVARYPDRFALVPEAATQVYAGLGTTWDRLNVENRRAAQRQIYRLQSDQERRIDTEYPDRVLLLDRGTIDGAAYWPDGPEAYWADVGTTAVAELAKYDAVVWMQTAAEIGVYDGAASNAVRFEDAAGAIANAKLLRSLWAPHPRLIPVQAFATVEEKIERVHDLVLSLIKRAQA